MKRKIEALRPVLVGICGGSASGKTWLAEALRDRLGSACVAVGLDGFYRDRSHVSRCRRHLANFDDPRAIDWKLVEQAVDDMMACRFTRLPEYDFCQHSRRLSSKVIRPHSIILVEGLWTWRRPSLKRRFRLKIYIDCSERLRVQRRISRDCTERGRKRSDVLHQLANQVIPMHRRYVEPLRKDADLVVSSPTSSHDITRIAKRILEMGC